jgi:hypothetical protein
MMTDRDLNYLKRATPAVLMPLANGIPWEICCLIKVELTLDQTGEADQIEQAKWMAAGAVPNDPEENVSWLKERAEVCDECGQPRHEAKNRLTFMRERGFGLHRLCGNCAQDFDHHFDPRAWAKTAAELASRWQGRCLTRREVAQ